MEIYHAEDGGRYMYADDIERLQDVALELEQLFSGCDDCVISGCAVTSSSGTLNISAGLVYLDGKIRKVSQYSGSAQTIYLIVSNSTKNVSYASGTPSRIGVYVYGTQWATSSSSVHRLVFTSSNTVKRLDKGLFGKYALLLNGGNQSVNGVISFPGQIKPTTIIFPNSTNQIYTNNLDHLVIESTRSYGKSKINVGISDIGLWADELERLSVKPNLVRCTPAFKADLGVQAKDYAINDDGIYLGGTSDVGTFWLNKKGREGGTSVFRNFSIGDGKGNALLEITPSNVTTYKLYSPNNNVATPIIAITDDLTTPVTQIRGRAEIDQVRIKVVSETPSNDTSDSASNTTTITYEPIETYFVKTSDMSNYVLKSYLTENYTTTEGLGTVIDGKIDIFKSQVTSESISINGGSGNATYMIQASWRKWNKICVLSGYLQTNIQTHSDGINLGITPPADATVAIRAGGTHGSSGASDLACLITLTRNGTACTLTWGTNTAITTSDLMVVDFNIVYFTA